MYVVGGKERAGVQRPGSLKSSCVLLEEGVGSSMWEGGGGGSGLGGTGW